MQELLEQESFHRSDAQVGAFPFVVESAPPDSKYARYFVVKPEARITAAELKIKGFPEMDFSKLPTVAYGIKKDDGQSARAAEEPGIAIVGKIVDGKIEFENEPGTSAINERKLDRIAFHYEVDPTMVIGLYAIAHHNNAGHVIEYPILNAPAGSAKEVAEKIAFLQTQHPDFDWEGYNAQLEAKTGLDIFEMAGALTRIYYVESPLDQAKARYKEPVDFVAAKTKIPTTILPLILILNGNNWRQVAGIPAQEERKLLPAPEEFPLLTENPETTKLLETTGELLPGTVILNAVLSRREELLSGTIKPQELVQELLASGYDVKEVKKEMATFYFMLLPWYSQKEVRDILGSDAVVVSSAAKELPDWAKARRDYFLGLKPTRGTKKTEESSGRFAVGTAVIEGQVIALPDYINAHRDEIITGVLPPEHIAALFNMTTDWLSKAHLNQILGKENVARMRTNIKALERAPLIQSFMEVYLGLLNQNNYVSPRKVAQEMGLPAKQAEAILKAYYVQFPEIGAKAKFLRGSAQAERGLKTLENMPKVEFNGVGYDSHREALMSMLIQLYQDYFPVKDQNFQIKVNNGKLKPFRIDFKLTDADGKEFFAEFHPDNFRGVEKSEAYLARRQGIADAVDLRVFTKLRAVATFLIQEIGVTENKVNGKSLSQRISAFDNSHVWLGRKEMLHTEAIVRLINDPVALYNYFQPPIAGFLKVFSTQLDEPEFQDIARRLYKDIPQSQFEAALATTRELIAKSKVANDL